MIKNKKILAALVFLVALFLFFFFRLSKLNTIPVFVDEAIYVRWSQIMKTEASLRFVPQTDGKQPLFMWVTIPFFKLSSDPLIAGRLVSVATGFGSLLGIVFLSYILFGDVLIAALSALVYTLLPFTVFFDRMALVDSMLAMFGLWSLGLSVLFAKTHRLDHAMLLGFAIGGGLLTKSPAEFYYIWLIVALIFFFRPQKNENHALRDLLVGLFAVTVISQLMYNILRLGPSFNMIGARNQDYLFTWKEVLSHPLNPFIGNFKTTVNWFWLLFTPTILATLIFGLLPKKTRFPAIFLCLVSMIPLFGQAAIAKVYTSRYILFAVLPLILVCGLGLNWLVTRKGILIKLSSSVLLVVPIIISFLYVFQPTKAPMPYDMHNGYLEEWTAGWGQQDIANYFISLEAKGERVVAFTEGYFGTLPDGLEIYTEGHKNITIVGSNPSVSEIPDGLIKTDPQNQRFLIVNRSRDHLTPASLKDLQLLKEYSKPMRNDGTHEVLELYSYTSNSL